VPSADDAEGAVVTADLAALSSDEGDIDRGDALEHLIGSDCRSRAVMNFGKQWDHHLEVVGHAEVLSLMITRKERR